MKQGVGKSSEKGDARESALRLLCRVETDAAYAGRLLHSQRLDSQLEERDAALLAQLVKGTLQWRGKIDAALEKYLKKGVASLPLKIRNVLRLSAYQIMFLDRIPKEVAVSEAVKLTKKQKERDLSGLVNAVLRNLVRNLPEIMESLAARGSAEEIAISGSHPLWLVERWISQIGIEETQALCAANNSTWALQLRANTLRVKPSELLQHLEAEGVRAVPGKFCSEIVTVESLSDKAKLHEMQSFTSGLFQVQDESSALVAHLVAPQPQEFVIDLCSAPGGKTTHLAELMKNTGRIAAVDPNKRRLNLVKESCERLGIANVEYVAADGREFKSDCAADRVLVDAPCSGLGVLGRRSDARWNKSPDMFTDLVKLQLEILHNAARLLKPGGTLVYSTCSIDPQENEQVLESFLLTSPDFRLGSLPKSFAVKGLASECGYYRSWPQRHGIGGAFGAVLLKIS